MLEGRSDSESESSEEGSEKEESEQDIEEEQRILNKPLFSDDEGSDKDSDDDEVKKSRSRAKVSFDKNTEMKRKQSTTSNVSNNNASSKGRMSFATTKIGFDQGDFDLKYKGIETEKVWIDFGKVNTNVTQFDPDYHKEIDLAGHKMYFMMPPNSALLPSNVILFELIYLSSKSTTKDIISAWGAFPLVNGDFNIN